jgi:hypothetical protein
VGTHVGLYVEVLQIEGMLPNVNTDYGNVREERVLVGCGDDLQLAGGRVNALTNPKCQFLSIS